MFIRIKKSGANQYLQVVENRREGKRTIQRVIATLGRVDKLTETGAVPSLLRSLARFAPPSSPGELGALTRNLQIVSVRPLAPEIILRRIWQDLGLDELLSGGDATLDRERVLFFAVVERLLGSAVGQSATRWLGRQAGAQASEITQRQQDRASIQLAFHMPNHEMRLAQQRREGGSPGKMTFLHAVNTHLVGRSAWVPDGLDDSRTVRSDGVAAVLHNENGIPLACRLWADDGEQRLVPGGEISQLGEKFNSSPVCWVGDWAMSSSMAQSAAAAPHSPYLVGTAVKFLREHQFQALRRVGLQALARDRKPKELDLDGARHIVFHDAQETAQDAADWADVRQALVEHNYPSILDSQEDQAYWRRLTGKVAFRDRHRDERNAAKYQNLSILRTDTDLPASQLVVQYCRLQRIQELFGVIDAPSPSRPIAVLFGRVAVAFLGLLVVDELQRRLFAHDIAMKWSDLRAALTSIIEVEMSDSHEKHVLLAPLTEAQRDILQALGAFPRRTAN